MGGERGTCIISGGETATGRFCQVCVKVEGKVLALGFLGSRGKAGSCRRGGRGC